MLETANVAVLLAAYNGEKYISEQIETILSQKNITLHLYISIDLSTDNTYFIVQNLAVQHSEITILPYGKKHGSAARNFFHLLLNTPVESFDYIALSDQDDIWLEDKIERAIRTLKGNNADGYSSDVIAFWGNGGKKLIKKSAPQCKYDFLFEGPGPGCSFVLSQKLAVSLREYLKNNNDIKGIDWHDWLIYAFTRANNYKWIIDDVPRLLYRQHQNNLLGANLGIFAFLSRIKDIITGYGINQTISVIKYLNIKDNILVKNLIKNNKLQYWKLAIRANKCRRRKRDKYLFFVSCIMMSLLRPKIQSL